MFQPTKKIFEFVVWTQIFTPTPPYQGPTPTQPQPNHNPTQPKPKQNPNPNPNLTYSQTNKRKVLEEGVELEV